MSIRLSLAGGSTLAGGLALPGIPWPVVIGTAAANMLLVFALNVITENHRHREVSDIVSRAMTGAPMSEIATALAAIRPPRSGRRH